MAKRRMLMVEYLDSDNFNSMPNSAKMLYVYLNMHADDEGFCSGSRLAMALADATSEDMKMLEERKHIIIFDSGAVCIKHWQKHNQIKNDRLQETEFAKEREQLVVVRGVYQWKSDVDNLDTKCIPKVDKSVPKMEQKSSKNVPNLEEKNSEMFPQVSIGKNSIDKISKEEIVKEEIPKRFTPPQTQEVEQYIKDNGYHVNAERFCLFYASKGWMVGKNKMKDWKACVRTWEQKWKEEHPVQEEKPTGNHSFDADEFFNMAVSKQRSNG